jgi:hypothetical protein
VRRPYRPWYAAERFAVGEVERVGASELLPLRLPAALTDANLA